MASQQLQRQINDVIVGITKAQEALALIDRRLQKRILRGKLILKGVREQSDHGRRSKLQSRPDLRQGRSKPEVSQTSAIIEATCPS